MIINLIIIIVVALCFIGLFMCFYFQERNQEVGKFLLKINDDYYKSTVKLIRNVNINEDDLKELDIILNSLNKIFTLSYNKVLYGCKDLKLENFFNEDEIYFLTTGKLTDRLKNRCKK